jgi:hypothetical protein
MHRRGGLADTQSEMAQINKKQEVALWIIGLLWTGELLNYATASTPGDPHPTMTIFLALLIPSVLIIFSLRTR